MEWKFCLWKYLQTPPVLFFFFLGLNLLLLSKVVQGTRVGKLQVFFAKLFRLLKVCKFLIQYFPYWTTKNFISTLRYLFKKKKFTVMYSFWSLCSLANLVKTSTTFKVIWRHKLMDFCTGIHTHINGQAVWSQTIGWKSGQNVITEESVQNIILQSFPGDLNWQLKSHKSWLLVLAQVPTGSCFSFFYGKRLQKMMTTNPHDSPNLTFNDAT